MAAHLRQVRKIEDEDAAGIAARGVAIDVGEHGIFDLDAGDIVFGEAVPDHDLLRLADIDAGIRRAAHGDAIDEDVGGTDRIDAVGAVLRVGAVRPFDAEIDEADAVDALRLDTVALGVFDRKAGQEHAVRRHQQPLARALLALEAEHGPARTGALHGHAVDVERQAVAERIAAGRERHGVARCRLYERGLDRLLVVRGRRDRNGPGGKRRGGKQ